MKLRKAQTIEIIPSAPFDFDSTFHKPDHFTTGDNFWQPGTRWQTWRWRGEPLGLKFQNTGTVDHPALQVSVYAKERADNDSCKSLVKKSEYRYNLDLDLSGFYQAFADDPILGSHPKTLARHAPRAPQLFI
jgi:hypothetical protein